MKIRINNEEVETEALTLADIAAEKRLADRGVAMAIGGEMVPRGEWAEREIKEGDDILILKAFAGG